MKLKIEQVEQKGQDKKTYKLSALISEKVYAQFKAECALNYQSVTDRIGIAIEYDVKRMKRKRMGK